MIIYKNFSINFGSIGGFCSFLNQPQVKEAVKKTIGMANLIFAGWGIYDLGNSIRKGTFWSSQKTLPTRLIVLSARISIIGFALSTAPGYQMVGMMIPFLFNEKTILQWFGPHLNFATTPFHLRHIVSIASFILGIPALLHSIYTAIRTHRWIYRFNAFNIFTSRVILHAGNAFTKRIFN